jgi:D-alanine-D-alanine ligase
MILSRHDDEGPAHQTIHPRFSKMIMALKQGGIMAIHQYVGNADDLIVCLRRDRPSIVFSAAHYTQDQKNVHAILESLGWPYIGSHSETIELVLSKAALKDHWRRHGILTPDYYVVKKTSEGKVLGLDDLARAEDFPYIVKPSKEGNSRGLQEDSIVFDKTELDRLVARLLDEYDELLVEQYLGRYPDLREFTVAMIGNGSNALVMPAEITIQTSRRWRIVTTSDKDEHHTLAIPIMDKELSLKVEEKARQALLAAGVQDYARCDMLMAEGKLYAIEINGQPMLPDKWFAACARSKNMRDDQYINAIFLAGMVRHVRQKSAKRDIPMEMQKFLPEKIYNQLCNGS